MASTGARSLLRTGRLVTVLRRGQQAEQQNKQCRTAGLVSQTRLSSQDSTVSQSTSTFNERTLEHLVCPLSKKDLRYDKENNELVCDEIGVAYPIVNGIPNLVPQDARMLKHTSSSTEHAES